MFIPSLRLLWLVAVVFVPACALPAIYPAGKSYLAGVAPVLLIFAALDAFLSRNRPAEFSLSLQPTIRAVLNQETTFLVDVRSSAGSRQQSSRLRIAVAIPPEVDPVKDDILIEAPKQREHIEAQMALLGRERGTFSINQAYLGCRSWLGLWELRRRVSVEAEVLVEPALAQIARETARLLASHRHGGRRIIARNGRGREFEQLREYMPSDDFGDIDWKATARRRIPIVRDFQVERTQDIYACVDSSRLSGGTVVHKASAQGGGGPLGAKLKETRATILDEYIRSTLMLHCAVRQTGDRFGFATFSNRVEYFVKATHATSFDAVFRRALYPLRPKIAAPAFDEICGVLRSRVKRRALIVFFTSLAEPQLAESFLKACRLLVRQHLVVVACPTDVHTEPLFSGSEVDQVDDIYGKLAGHLLWKKLVEVRFELGQVGIRMHTVSPGRLGLVAATEYLDIKERQAL